MPYNEVATGNRWKPTVVGAKIEGKLVKREVKSGKNGDYHWFFIVDETGEESVVWGAVLEKKLGEVEDGSKVILTYKGEVRSKTGNTFPDYTVMVWSDDDKPLS